MNHKAKRILDVGCGSGNHCASLNKLGFETVGVDLNKKMFSYAKEKYPNLEFHIMNMKKMENVSLGKFDVILCLCTTFTFNTTNEEIDKVLFDFHKLLKRKGLLIIEVFNPISFLGKSHTYKSYFDESNKLYQRAGLVMEAKHTIDNHHQLLIEDKKIYTLDKRLKSEDRTTFRLLFPQEIRYYLNHNGLVVKKQYGKYDVDYRKLDGTRLITIALKE